MSLHVIPINGAEPDHVKSAECWCSPLVDSDPRLVIHHAKDCREKRERLGIGSTNLKWRIVEVKNIFNTKEQVP